ncbi:MAG TPA: acetyl-CoA carboxylase carboxyl transferase subunit alpha, partial [Verrucomicrobiae bacterium]|nr:acetyl-CoA carboxylase carboxyl transferase subunit alpha [Verrucomicrobiae bacterium]
MKHQLDFEKPIFELQSKLDELKKHKAAHSLDVNIDEEIAQIQSKLVETRKQVFSNLT